MERSLTCFLPFSDTASVKATVASLRESDIVRNIFIVVPPGNEETFKVPGAGQIAADSFVSTEALKKMAAVAGTSHVLTYSKGFHLDMGKHSPERMMQVCTD